MRVERYIPKILLEGLIKTLLDYFGIMQFVCRKNYVYWVPKCRTKEFNK